jgi:hypothetical protein
MNVNIDIDKKSFMNDFKFHTKNLYAIYYKKRTYFPVLYIKQVKRTRKGWHIKLLFQDKEKSDDNLKEITIRQLFGDDRLRCVYDYLRMSRKENIHSLLFDYKNKRKAILREDIKNKMNKHIKKQERIWKKFEEKNKRFFG